MKVNKPFQIGKLPAVVMRKVYSNMALFELIDLAQCSKKIKSLVKAFNTRQLELYIDLSYEFFVHVSEFVSSRRYILKRHQFQSNSPNPIYRFHNREKGVRALEMSVERTLALTECFSDVFGAHLKSLIITPDRRGIDLYKVIDRLQNIQNPIDYCEIVGEVTIEKMHDYILSIMNFNEVNYQIEEYADTFSEGGICCEKLRIEYSRWFELSNLLESTSCYKIQLKNSYISARDLNEFLLEWVTGALPNLLFLSVESDNGRDSELVMDGLEMLDAVEFEGRQHECFSGTEQHIIDGKYIRRVDGVIATFHIPRTADRTLLGFMIFEFALLTLGT